MKVSLELNLEAKGVSKKKIKEELVQMLFEVCEEWVLRGQEPDLDFSEED